MNGRHKPRLPAGVEVQELRTLDDLADGVVAYIQCKKCGRLTRLDIGRYGDYVHRPLYEIRVLSRCAGCGTKRAQTLLRNDAARGDNAWVPRPPMLFRD